MKHCSDCGKTNPAEIHTCSPQKPAQQEPVGMIEGQMYDDGTRASNVIHWASRNAENDFPVGTLLYTSPPAQSTWVGLTDEEISKMPAWIYSPDQDGMTAEEGLEVFARAIEAKLKEKNT